VSGIFAGVSIVARWSTALAVSACATVAAERCAALGFWLTSRADTLGELYWSYALIGGVGIGFSTILPSQTLAVNWFVRYRARATAIILVGGSAVGVGHADRRARCGTGAGVSWLLIAGCSLWSRDRRSFPRQIGGSGAGPDGRTRPA
jgi:hypothetical protein